MREPADRSRVIFTLAVACLLGLNLVILAAAYPETMRIDTGCCSDRPLAKDFSAFYTAAWRLIHDPAQVYTLGYVNDGEYHVLPQPETYKYLPSFLFLLLPFLALPYQAALTAFDVFQFLLLPLVALLLYEVLKGRSVGWSVAVAVVALLLPLPSTTPAHALTFSAPYYYQWAEGQSKVLETFFLLLSFYLGKSNRPSLSGFALALAAFDPRFVVVSIPLFLAFNRSAMKVAVVTGVASCLALNVPLLYPPMGAEFLSMLVDGALVTPFYFYSLIPLLTVLALTAAHADLLFETFRRTSIRRTPGAAVS